MANHQAAEQMIGYLYQIRYALFLLLDNDNTGYQVSIEKFDDVAFDDNGTPKELIQLKHHINNQGSLTDYSVDLWRTLKVWMDMIEDEKSILYDADFLLITTSTAPEDSIAAALKEKNKDVDAIYSVLKKIAEEKRNQTNKKAYEKFSSMDEAIIKKLLERIIIIDYAADIVDVENAIRKCIRYSCEQRHEDFVYERIEGWWFKNAIMALTSNEPCFFNQTQIRSLIRDFAREYDADNLPIDDDILMIGEVEESDLPEKQRIFLVQLRLLRLKNNHLNIALQDYYRAYEQRSRWIRNDLLYVNELSIYERRLVDAWRDAYTWMVDDLEDSVLPITEEDIIKAGKKLYKEVTGKDIRIRDKCQEPFVMKGSYHLLSNKLKVGWHKDFYDRLSDLLVKCEED